MNENIRKETKKSGFVTKGDAFFFKGLLALVRSLRISNPETPILVFDCGLTPDQHRKLSQMVDYLIPLDIVDYKIKEIDRDRFTSSIYSSAFLELCPFDNIFHLDADTIVLEDLSKVFEICSECEFAGVSDFPKLSLLDQVLTEYSEEIFGTIFVDWSKPAFNGGIFCINKEFYTNRIKPRMMQLAKYHLMFKTNDQALLNLAYYSSGFDDFYDLGILYNFRPHFSRAPLTKFEKRIVNPHGYISGEYKGSPIKILHFIRSNKPWHPDFDKNSLAFEIWSQFLF